MDVDDDDDDNVDAVKQDLVQYLQIFKMHLPAITNRLRSTVRLSFSHRYHKFIDIDVEFNGVDRSTMYLFINPSSTR